MEGSMALSQLAGLDELHVTQEAPRRVFAGNKYVMRTAVGEELLTAKEEGTVLGGHNRAFLMPVYDIHGLEMMRLRRPQRCGGAKVVVTVEGAVAAVVRQRMTWCGLLVYINDAADLPRYRVRGIPWRNTVDFRLQTMDKNTIGVVRKEYGGFMREAFTRLDSYTLNFPVDMELRFKAGVIAACIMIDFLLYEKN